MLAPALARMRALALRRVEARPHPSVGCRVTGLHDGGWWREWALAWDTADLQGKGIDEPEKEL